MATRITDENRIAGGEPIEVMTRRLAECGSLIKGSLVVNRRRCGNPRCRCARGELHESLAITYKEKSRSVLVHVPRHLQAAAQRAVEDYHTLKQLVAAIHQLNVNAFRERAGNDRLQSRSGSAEVQRRKGK